MDATYLEEKATRKKICKILDAFSIVSILQLLSSEFKSTSSFYKKICPYVFLC